MSKLAVLTKPRFSLLHLAAFGFALVLTACVLGHWSDFKAGVRDGYNATSEPATQLNAESLPKAKHSPHAFSSDTKPSRSLR